MLQSILVVICLIAAVLVAEKYLIKSKAKGNFLNREIRKFADMVRAQFAVVRFLSPLIIALIIIFFVVRCIGPSDPM